MNTLRRLREIVVTIAVVLASAAAATGIAVAASVPPPRYPSVLPVVDERNDLTFMQLRVDALEQRVASLEMTVQGQQWPLCTK